MRPEERKLAIQIRCVWCHREQYAPAVYNVSLGKAGCSWCGKKSKKMTFKKYSDKYNCGYPPLKEE